MRELSHVVIVLLFLGLTISCEKDTSIIGSGPPGSFSYQSYDSLGSLAGVGWLAFEFTGTDSTQMGGLEPQVFVKLEGEWHIKKITNRHDLGPQFGDGELVGGTYDSRIWMALNPQIRDNNISLHGTIENNRIEGKWYHTGWVTNWGTFKATKN